MQVQIIENRRLSEREIDLLSDALKKSNSAFKTLLEVFLPKNAGCDEHEVKKCVEIGDFEEAETGRMLKVYTDKNGLLTI